MLRGRLAVVLALSGVLVATGAAGEVYRYTDERGREHFVSSLDRVPPRHRAAARRGAGTGSGAVNLHRTVRPAPRGASKPSAGPAPATGAPDAAHCAAVRREIVRRERVVRTHRRSVESSLRRADDITLSAFSRRRHEARAEEEGAWLAKAEAELEALREAERRAGTAPGCLR